MSYNVVLFEEGYSKICNFLSKKFKKKNCSSLKYKNVKWHFGWPFPLFYLMTLSQQPPYCFNCPEFSIIIGLPRNFKNLDRSSWVDYNGHETRSDGENGHEGERDLSSISPTTKVFLRARQFYKLKTFFLILKRSGFWEHNLCKS